MVPFVDKMGTLLQLSCPCCKATWEISGTTRDTKTVYCGQCADFVTLSRIAYSRSRFPGCWRCGVDTSTQAPVDQQLSTCPKCEKGVLEFAFYGTYLPDNSIPPLKVGDVIEAWFDEWSIRVFDLPAIPRENVTGIENKDVDGVWRLEVLQTPNTNQSDREYYFRLLGPL